MKRKTSHVVLVCAESTKTHQPFSVFIVLCTSFVLPVSPSRSIIRHILSQVRIGMDLTKFTLPAFLMAPRSTLEMYASIFGRTSMLTTCVETIVISY